MLNEGYKVKPITEVRFTFVPIKTVGLPFFKKIWAWRTQSRRIVLRDDWFVRLPNGDVVWIPKGTDSDGSSIPRAMRWLDSPYGPSLTAGYIHDVIYRFRCLLNPDGSYYKGKSEMTRFEADYLFKRINFNVNDLTLLATMMFYALRIFGGIAWKQHRCNDGKMKNNIKQFLPKEDGEP